MDGSYSVAGIDVHKSMLAVVISLFLAQAHSNRAPRGRKRDFADAERLLRRHVAGELILSFVPDAEQRRWRIMTRSRHQLTRQRVRLHNQVESFLEDARIKRSGCVSGLLGVSSRRILKALAGGETDVTKIAALADPALRATPEQLQDALSAAATLGLLPSADSRPVSGSAGSDGKSDRDPGQKYRFGAPALP